MQREQQKRTIENQTQANLEDERLKTQQLTTKQFFIQNQAEVDDCDSFKTDEQKVNEHQKIAELEAEVSYLRQYFPPQKEQISRIDKEHSTMFSTKDHNPMSMRYQENEELQE